MESSPPRRRSMALAIAACCVLPVLAIVALSSLLGFALGRAAALVLGVLVGIFCVLLMWSRHGKGHH